MPLPLILGGLAAIAGAAGVGAGVHGAVKMKEANDTQKEAQERHNRNLKRFERASDKTNQEMDSLGKLERSILKDFDQFSEAFEKIQNRPEFKDLAHEKFQIPQYDREELKKASVGAGVLLGGLGGAAAGTAGGFAAAGATTAAVMALGTASTGTAIASLSGAAAVNATLAALGGGALAPYADDKIILGDNYETYDRICNGPIRTKVVFTYKPFDVDGHLTTLKRELTIDANTNFIKISNWYNAAVDQLPVVLGAVLHDVLDRTDGENYIAFTEKASDSADPDADGDISVGLVVDAAEEGVEVGTMDGHAVLKYNITPGKRADVWTGSGWSKGGIESPEAWAQMVEDFAYAQANPLEVTVR